MTNPTISMIAALLDRSGSMTLIADDTRGGFDAYIAAQRGEPGTTRVTLAQFDNRYEIVYQDRDIADVPALTLEPRGGTALLDAIGRFVTEVGAGLSALPEDQRPGDVTVLVMTDGHENASTAWTAEAIRDLIAHQESVYSWDFVFLAANLDAVDVGGNLGFSADKSLTFAASPQGVAGAWDAVTHYSARKRSALAAMRDANVGFTDQERTAASPKDTN